MVAMAFDVFEKISELETKVYLLETELHEKDDLIKILRERNQYLEEKISNAPTNDCSSHGEKSIAETLREASEGAVQHTGYVFDDRTGLYYDHKSGYYYDPDNRMFYEPKSGVYYAYNPETGQYLRESPTEGPVLEHLKSVFQKKINEDDPPNDDGSIDGLPLLPAQRDAPDSLNTTSGKKSRKSTLRRSYSDAEDEFDISRRDRRERRKSKKTHDRKSTKKSRHRSPDRTLVCYSPEHREISAKALLYPPTVRLVVLSSNSAPSGTVYLLDSKECSEGWGCIGSSSAFCTSVNFPKDTGVIPIHCEVVYHTGDRVYSILNRDSPTGTHLNGDKLSEGEERTLRHADILRLASVRLLLHIHEGKEFCQQCDASHLESVAASIQPVTVEKSDPEDKNNSQKTLPDTTGLETERRVKLTRLRSKYGLKQQSVQNVASKIKTQYIDRAARRRALEKNPRAINNNEPPASINGLPIKRIVKSNPQHEKKYGHGAKLLQKMGWKPGQGLGKQSTGITEPIKVKNRMHSLAGLGCERGASQHDRRDVSRSRGLEITRQRYNNTN